MFMPSMESFRALQPSSPSWLPENQMDHFQVLSGGGHIKQQEMSYNNKRCTMRITKDEKSSVLLKPLKKLFSLFLGNMAATCTLVGTKILYIFMLL